MSSESEDEPNGRQEDAENQSTPNNGAHSNLPQPSGGSQLPWTPRSPGPSYESGSEPNIPENTNSNTGQQKPTLPRQNTMVSYQFTMRNAC